MLPRCRPLGLLVALVLAAPAGAEVYRYVDKNGNLVLSDTVPGERAERVERVTPRPVMTVPALAPRGARKPPAPEKKASPAMGDYVVVIQSPGADATYQRAGEPIPIAFSIDPALQPGHRVDTLLDGAKLESAQAISPEQLDRGSHILEIRLSNAEGKTLKSSTVTFHIHQPSAQSPLHKKKPSDNK